MLALAAVFGSARFRVEAWHGYEPQRTAHAKSAHARVACRVCHAGGGRPSAQVCLDCHPMRKASGDRLRVVDSFAADRENSATRTVLLTKRRSIHGAHARADVLIFYSPSDEKRQVIPRVEVRHTGARGRDEVYRDEAAAAPQGRTGAYLMDCIDCHNRTAHAFDPPSRALDRVLSEDTLSPSLPFIKRAGLELLLGHYAGSSDAAARMRADLARFYRQQDPETYEKHRAEIVGAAQVLAGIYQRDWVNYPDNLGHTRFPGCFRCHDGRHATARGTPIPSGCQVCHEMAGDAGAG